MRCKRYYFGLSIGDPGFDRLIVRGIVTVVFYGDVN